MAQSNDSGTYHEWRSFLRCPDCGDTEIDFDHYDDGTMFYCQQCGAEAWAAKIVKKDI